MIRYTQKWKKRNKKMKHKTVCVVGLEYVGLPLAEAFSKHLKVIAFDIDQEKVKRLNESNNEDNIEFTSDPSKIKEAVFVLIAVPTPVTKSKEPDLSYVKLFCFAIAGSARVPASLGRAYFTKNAYAISNGNRGQEPEERSRCSSGVYRLSGSDGRDCEAVYK